VAALYDAPPIEMTLDSFRQSLVQEGPPPRLCAALRALRLSARDRARAPEIRPGAAPPGEEWSAIAAELLAAAESETAS